MSAPPKIEQLPPFYEFGPFAVDAGKRLLLRNGEPVPLAPKVLETLLVLIENRERVLSKDELLNQVWGDTIVEEGGLTRNISVLRKALGEKPEDHQYVVTVPARGYQFVAEVRVRRGKGVASDAHAAPAQQQEQPWWSLSARRWFVLGASALGLAMLSYALRPVRATDLRGPLPSVNAVAYRFPAARAVSQRPHYRCRHSGCNCAARARCRARSELRGRVRRTGRRVRHAAYVRDP